MITPVQPQRHSTSTDLRVLDVDDNLQSFEFDLGQKGTLSAFGSLKENCRNKADVWSSRNVEKLTPNLIAGPPSYFRRIARAASVDSQIEPIGNADGTADK
jgi:hypothetical protein